MKKVEGLNMNEVIEEGGDVWWGGKKIKSVDVLPEDKKMSKENREII